jgi:hypothetical protein
MDLYKYIGIPYELHGRTFDGCDCYGLVYLYFSELGYALPKLDKPYILEEAEQLVHTYTPLLAGEQLEVPESPCIVVMYKHFIPTHVGVFVDGGIIHTSQKRGSVYEKLKNIKKRFTGLEFYRVSESYYTG